MKETKKKATPKASTTLLPWGVCVGLRVQKLRLDPFGFCGFLFDRVRAQRLVFRIMFGVFWAMTKAERSYAKVPALLALGECNRRTVQGEGLWLKVETILLSTRACNPL